MEAVAGVHAPPTEHAQSQVVSSHITCSQTDIGGGGADWAGYRADEEKGDHITDWAGKGSYRQGGEGWEWLTMGRREASGEEREEQKMHVDMHDLISIASVYLRCVC